MGGFCSGSPGSSTGGFVGSLGGSSTGGKTGGRLCVGDTAAAAPYGILKSTREVTLSKVFMGTTPLITFRNDLLKSRLSIHRSATNKVNPPFWPKVISNLADMFGVTADYRVHAALNSIYAC
jgi:hypothetical protein